MFRSSSLPGSIRQAEVRAPFAPRYPSAQFGCLPAALVFPNKVAAKPADCAPAGRNQSGLSRLAPTRAPRFRVACASAARPRFVRDLLCLLLRHAPPGPGDNRLQRNLAGWLNLPAIRGTAWEPRGCVYYDTHQLQSEDPPGVRGVNCRSPRNL